MDYAQLWTRTRILLALASLCWAACDGDRDLGAPRSAPLTFTLAFGPLVPTGAFVISDVTLAPVGGGEARVVRLGGAVIPIASNFTTEVPMSTECAGDLVGAEVELGVTIIGVYAAAPTTLGDPGSPAPAGAWPLATRPTGSARGLCGSSEGASWVVTVPNLLLADVSTVPITILNHVFEVQSLASPLMWQLVEGSSVEFAPGYWTGYHAVETLPAIPEGRDLARLEHAVPCARRPGALTDETRYDRVEGRLASPPARPAARPLRELPEGEVTIYATCDEVPEPAPTLEFTPLHWAAPDDTTDGRVRFGSLLCEPLYACDAGDAADADEAPLQDASGRALPTVTVGLRCQDLDPDAALPPTLHSNRVEVWCGPDAYAWVNEPTADGLACTGEAGGCGEIVRQHPEDALIRQVALERFASAERESLWRLRLGFTAGALDERGCRVGVRATATPTDGRSLGERWDAGRYPVFAWSVAVSAPGEPVCAPSFGEDVPADPFDGLSVLYDGNAGRPAGFQGTPNAGLRYQFVPAGGSGAPR